MNDQGVSVPLLANGFDSSFSVKESALVAASTRLVVSSLGFRRGRPMPVNKEGIDFPPRRVERDRVREVAKWFL